VKVMDVVERPGGTIRSLVRYEVQPDAPGYTGSDFLSF